METGDRRVLLAGVLGAVVVLAVLFALVGPTAVLETLAAADRRLVAVVVGFALCWLAAWGLMLRVVLASLTVEVPTHTAIVVYVGAVFANNVTPFGQAGGEPVAALLIAKVSDCRYETGLAGIASVDVLNVVPSLSLVVVGVGYYATTAAVGDRLVTAVMSAVAIIGTVVIVLALAWRHRKVLVDRLPAVIAPIVARLTPGRSAPDTLEDGLSERLERFFADVERVGTDRRQLSVVVGLSLLGWLAQAGALTAAFAAVGQPIPPHVVVFAIPLANLAGATPLPGGLGGIEAAYVALLVPTTGVAAATVTAAVLVFRGATYWMPVVLGGIITAAFGISAVRAD